MIQIVMKPDYDVKPEEGENCYKCLFNGEDVGFRVWGQRASHAEEKLMVIFREQLKEKVVDYDLEEYRKRKEGSSSKGENSEGQKCERAEKTASQEAPELPGLENA